VNRIVFAALAVSLLGGSGASAQSDRQSPVHGEISGQNPGALSAPGGEQKAVQNASEQTSVPPGEIAAAGRGQRRLIDPQSGCSALDINDLQVDAVAWSGDCVGGLASGPGTITFSNRGKFVQSLAGDFDRGVARDGHVKIKFANGSNYDGDEVAARMEGSGLLTTAEGDRLQGQWANNRLNGHGVVTWDNGDRYEGEWRDGKAEGRGIQIWSDGRKYDGEWRNDLPNGHGVVTRKDGSRYEGMFIDGHAANATEMAAVVPVGAPDVARAKMSATVARDAAETAAANNPASADSIPVTSMPSIDELSDKKFAAIDGSTFALTATEGGLSREILSLDGTVKRTHFVFLNDKLGTVYEGDDSTRVEGVFRLTGTGVATDYSDGRSETLMLNGEGGVSMKLTAPAGETTCIAWYPEGHRFSTEERQAAVAEYADRIGLHQTHGKKFGTGANPDCMVVKTELAPVPYARVLLPKNHTRRRADAAPQAAMAANLMAPSIHDPNKPIVVPTSQVHLIDADAPLLAETPETNTIATDEPASVAPGSDQASASACLNVESDGRHWGFRNRCAFDVQYVYCLMNADDALTSCREAAVSGSVAANGFGTLIADQGLHDTNADHDFRWVACGGGAGEVVVHLDRSDPPSGRCVRPGAS
jgi:hypothetical protein